MKEVFYLSYSNSDEGLVFPSELENGIYAPGIWVIQAESKKACPKEFLFDAVDNDEVIKLITRRLNNVNYQVDTQKYGKINLRLIEVYRRYNRYVGRSKIIDSNLRFFQLVPIDILKMSELCLKEKFFLIGTVDPKIE